MTERQFIIPTQPNMGRGLVNHDERSKAFRAVDIIDQTKPRNRSWIRGRAYDQGNNPHCVAFTGKGILNTLKLSHGVDYDVRRRYSTDDFYAGAQANDEWPGENYDGTSGLGLCRFLASRGIIREYRWCFGLEDVLRTLSWVGPVGLGIWWYESMFDPSPDGFVSPAGNRAGGHEIELTGVDVHRETVTLTNSWGVGWGMNGKAKLTWSDLDRLLSEQGDAFVITQ